MNLALAVHLWHRLGLISQLVRRDVNLRFKGALLGVLWPLLTPLLTLAMFTLVFGLFMRARWPGTEGVADFALILFPGLILFTFFSECVNRAPVLITSNLNYVKKVVFPLGMLPLVTMGTALFNLLLGIVAWMAITLFVKGTLPLTMLYVPVVVAPFLLVVLGISWFLAALGVYLRDVNQVVPVITQAMMFLSPVLYPLDNVPEEYRWIVLANPLTLIVEQLRIVMISGGTPSFSDLGLYALMGILFCWLGYRFFQALRPGFSDVV